MAETRAASDHGPVQPLSAHIAVVGAALALASAGCGGKSVAAETSPTTSGAGPTASTGGPAGGPGGEAAPAKLQGTWRLVSKSPEQGLIFVITDRHYRVPTRLAHGDLVVDGDEIQFFNAAICGLTLPEGVGRYRWTVKGDRLHFEAIGKEPCGGRADILANATYERTG
jgi:hypothetical protein